MWFFVNIASFTVPGLLSYGFLIFVTVYAYTDFMDKNGFSIVFEILKNVFGLVVLLSTDLWSPLSADFSFMKTVYLGYFVLSALLSVVFYKSEILNFNRFSVAKEV